MTVEEREKTRKWVNTWKKTGKFLERLRIEEFQRSNRTEVILALSDASESALEFYPPKPTSGLIEMQKLFLKVKKK